MILRNSVLSLGSLAIPLLVGLITVPKILHGLGLERFGVLTLIWAVVGFSSLLDLGISRALTKRVAELHRQSARLHSLIRTGLGFIALLALGMGLVALAMTGLFDFERFKLSRDEFEQSSFLLAVSISIVIVGGGFRGVLEGLHRFAVVSFVRLGFGLITFIAPLLVLESTPRIDYIIAIMLVARIVGALIMAWSCRAYLSKGRRSHARRWIELRQLVVMGGWMTLSNLASVLMLYIDRFFIAGSTFASTLALYTTPYEFVTKLFIIPSALSSVLFPQMASTARSSSAKSKLLAMGSAAILASVTPMIAPIMLFAPEVLGWWVSPEFGQDASLALRVLSIGVLVNCLAQIFQTYLLGCGRAAWLAWMHCLELCIFLPMLYLAIQHFGLEGAAWAWTVRVLFDSAAMAFMLGSIAMPSRHHWWSLLASTVLAFGLFFCSNLDTGSKWALLAALCVLCACFGLWCFRQWQNRLFGVFLQDPLAAREYLSDSRQKTRLNVTVVIVNWNGEQFLNQCLTALVAQTVKPHEIIVLDNASTDGSVEIAQRFPSVRLMAMEQNTGFARGNNLAIEAASAESEWIVLLNPDAFPEPSWLEALLAAAESHPVFDVFGSKLVNAADSTLLDGTGDVYHISSLVWRTAHGVPLTTLSESACEIFSPCAAAALYRRSVFEKAGGFDEDFFCYVEDVDLGFRLRLAGYRCLYVPQSVAHHVGSGTTGGQHSDFSVYHGHRNLVWTFVKNMPGVLFWLLLPLHVVLNLVSIIWFALRGQGAVILRAKRDALLGLPKMWRKRQQLQKARVASVRDIWRVLDKRLLPMRRKT